MKIAICDDDSLCRTKVLDIIADYAEERKDADILFEVFSNPQALLDAVRVGNPFDIYLLDIVMPEINGIALGQALRSSGAEGKIIYLTSSKEYALESFRVRAFDYILKPVEKAPLWEALDRAIAAVPEKKTKVLIVKTKDSNARIAYDNVLYAELKRRAVTYHLTNGTQVESTTLRTTFTGAVSKLLSDSCFVLCGASMVVNMHHVTMVENDAIVFTDDTRVFLGVKACRKLRADWNAYWITQEGS